MANLGMADSLIIMVIALVVFGPRRLPQIGRQIGKLMYEFRKASNDFKFQMEEELRTSEEADRRKKEEERQRALALAAPAPEVVVVKASSTEAESIAVAASTEPAAEETYPRIQPPSTGETVAAACPNNAALAAELGAAESTEQPALSAAPEVSAAEAMMSEGAPAIPGAPEPEQAAHHG
jgi:sec-independent protein translocase protein TatB